jgi:hypothetical protein
VPPLPGQPGPRREVLEFGSGRPGRRWVSRAVLACLVIAAAVTVVVRAGGHQPRPARAAAPPPPPVRVTLAGHRLLGVTAGWELFARGPDDLLRIQLARGRITRTYVPSLDSASPDVSFVIGPREAVIRPADLVPGYIVPDGQQARLLTGPLAAGGPLVPGPAGPRAAWVTTGPPTSPALSLVTLTGHRTGPVIRFPPGGPQVPANAVPDGRGDVLVSIGTFEVYDAGPGFDRPVPGTVIAVGPARWLVVACDPQYRHCRDEVISTAGGPPLIVPGPPTAQPFYGGFSWPPTGVISPDGRTAAVAQSVRDGAGLTVHLISLRTGVTRDLGVPLGIPGSDVPLAADLNAQSMAWSPDGRWLFVAARGGKLIAISTRTGRPQPLGVTLPPVDQLAIRP